ncbi:amino acid deaminase/aldolase [Streptomyces polychromogenes]|uniref:Amino acid deaminase/aldolase n=2 Tax=Streptomyces TaxID=1883 RepID=A0ABN0VEE3_9ACTN
MVAGRGGRGRRLPGVVEDLGPRCRRGHAAAPPPVPYGCLPVLYGAVAPARAGTGGGQGRPDPYPSVRPSGKLPPMTSDRARYDRATARLDAPLAIVDLDAFDANADDLVRRAGGKPVRVASKSVRCRSLLERVLARPGFAGIMSYTLAESLWLARSGFGDVLLAYPSADRAGFGELAGDAKLAGAVTVMVDDPAQLDLIDRSRSGRAEEIRVCLELDTSLRLLGGRVRVGARRSPLREPGQLAELARAVASRPGFRVVGLMAYEGHVAGVGDAVAGRPVRSRMIRLMQGAARRELAARRGEVVRAVRSVVPDLEFVNGGGTGSVAETAAEEAVTEIAAGSGLYMPRLFDNYTSFRGRPAALFAQPVVRRPGVGVVTVLGGGYPASGAAGADRLPVPYLPAGLRYDPQEGAGEVQTPLLGSPADDLLIGDRVWFRHAKAGELCERFDTLHLVEGDRVTASVPTYRGEGLTFL